MRIKRTWGGKERPMKISNDIFCRMPKTSFVIFFFRVNSEEGERQNVLFCALKMMKNERILTNKTLRKDLEVTIVHVLHGIQNIEQLPSTS